MADRVLQRRDTAANWAAANPILAEGELGIVTDTKGYKIGDGVTHWNDLAYPSNPTQVVDNVGTSTTAAISQRAVTDLLNEGYLFVGIASPTTQPITPKGKVFYLAFEQGTYSNFNGIVLDDLDIKVLYNYTDGKWYSLTLGIKTFTHNFINIYKLLGGLYTLEEAVAAIPSKVTNPALLYFRNKNYEYELYELVYDAEMTDKKWRAIGSKALNVLNKKITINLNNVEFTWNKNNAIHLKISSNSYVYLKKNRDKVQELSYLLLNPCDVTTDVTNNAIALSDTPDSYTRCTYNSSIYVVTNPIALTHADDIIALTISGTIFAIPALIAKWQVTEQVNSLSEQVTELSAGILNEKITVRDWDWSSLTGQSLPASGDCIVPIPIPTSGYINVSFYPRNLQLDAKFKLYTKNQEGKYQEQSVLYTLDKSEISASILSLIIPTKVEIGDTELYLGCDNCRYYDSAEEGDFVLLINNGSYKGLLLSYSLVGDTSKELSSLSEQVTGIEGEIQEINDKLEELTPTEDNEQIEEKEYWIKVQGNTFDSSELYTANGASVSDNSVSLGAATSYVALNKIYWSNRRIHKFIVTPTTLGTLVINLAQNISNAMYPTFTGGNWTSAFKIDFSNKKIYMGDNIGFDMSSMNIVAGRKYIIELKYIKRVFYVTITDFLNYDSYTATLDARDSNKNGGFKNILVIQNQSGNYTVEQIETYEVANPTLVLFGDSVTEAIGRVGEGQNFSEIISEKIKSCTIIAQGGAGMGSWNNIFENEIKYIKPKYCSFHMGLNGGFSNTQLEKFITDCESIGTIPILNHVICNTQIGTDNTQETYNSILDGVVEEKGYMGYHGDIATATNNDITSQSNYLANNAADGKFNIKKTAMSKDCFNTYTIAAGKTVIEDEEERILDSPLEVIIDIHPKAAGHKMMADRYLKEVYIV